MRQSEDARRIVIIQRGLAHYRVPVLEALNRRFPGGVHLVSPPTAPDGASQVEAESPVPIHPVTVRSLRVFGRDVAFRISGIDDALRALAPRVVITEGNPRILSNWKLARRRRSDGFGRLVWTKAPNPAIGPVKRAIWKKWLRPWDGIITYGQTSHRWLLELGVPEEKVFVAQNAVEVAESQEQFATLRVESEQLRETLGLRGSLVVVCLGRLVPGKRVNDVIEAFVSLAARRADAVLCVVGGGPVESKARELARHRLRQEGLEEDRVRFMGVVPAGQDAVWLSLADIAVFAGAAGLGTNVSLAAETATLIADESGPDTELVIHDQTGVRFRRGDVGALARELEDLAADEHKRARLGQCGRQEVLKRATIGRMVDGIEEGIRYVGGADFGSRADETRLRSG